MLKKNTASQNLTFCLVNASDGSALTGATVTARRSIDGGAQASAAGSVTELGNGQYNFAPSQADTNGDLIGYLFTATGAIPVNLAVRTTAADLADSVRLGLTALPNAAAAASGGLITFGTSTGQLNVSGGRADANTTYIAGAAVSTSTAQLGVNVVNFGGSAGTFASGRPEVNTTHWAGTAVGSTTVRADLINIAGAAVNTSSAQLGVNVVNAAGTAWNSGSITASTIADAAIDRATFAADTGLQTTRSNTAQAGASGTVTLDASASSTTDFYKGEWVYLTGGTGVGQARLITAYNGTTKVATVAPNWATAPDNTSTFAVLPVAGVDVELIKNTVTAGTAGYVGIDWSAINAPTTSVSLSGTTISTSQVVASVTGAVGSVTGNVGGNVAGSVGSVTARVTANTDQLAGQTVTASAGVTFPDTVASPTNITAGTITTVTNLTNAPTSGDFTATMKTSIGTAVAASAVASVTGNVGGNVTGSVGSVATGGISSASFAAGAISASAIAADAIGASELAADAVAEIAGAVWDVTLASHLTAGSTGLALNAAGSAGDPWSTSLPGAYSAGSAGYIVGTNLDAAVSSRSTYAGADTAGTTTLLGRLSSTRAGYLDNLSAGAVALEATAQSILDDTGTSGVVVASLAANSITAAVLASDAGTEIATAVWAAGTRTLTSGGSGATAQEVWEYATRTLTATPDVDSGDLTAAACNKIADHVIRRTMANVEASSDGDTLGLSSLYGSVQQMQESSVSSTTLSVYKTDGSTLLGTKTLTVTPGANPITGIT